jgi:hypothetical protein
VIPIHVALAGIFAIRKGIFAATPSVAGNREGFSFLTSGRTVGHLERSPDRVVLPPNDAANRCNPHRPALVAKERPNGAAERSLGRIMPTTMAKTQDHARNSGTNCQQFWQTIMGDRLESMAELSTTLACHILSL